MNLNKLIIKNFRKFGSKDNVVSFTSNISVGDQHLLNSTLIVGQNNAGKTSVIKAIQKSCGDNNERFGYSDFNYYYLKELLKCAVDNCQKIKEYIDNPLSASDDLISFVNKLIPFISLTFVFCVDINEDSQDLLTNIGPLIVNEIPSNGMISFTIKYETTNLLPFIKSLFEIAKNDDCLETKFESFLSLLEKFTDEYVINCYINDDEPTKIDFKLKTLLKINSVSFEKLHSPSRLTDAFNKIYKYRVNQDDNTKADFDKRINDINNTINETIKTGKEISSSFNDVISKTTDSSKISMELKANLNLDSLLNNVIKYVYKDGRFEIPEDQFGMGYTNLMLIISELVDYIDNAPENDFYNKINLLVIEEPESYMHPQMQKVLIENINSAFYEIIKAKSCSTGVVNCQLIITSHSPFVLSGKIGVENTFNNVNYIRYKQLSSSSIVPLSDNIISTNESEFEFLKRYIRFKCCELFFADAAIFVEGMAEETIIPFFVSKDNRLNKKYISFFNINGAYFHIYEKLIKTLRIPIAIFTDLDIEGSKESDDQITTLKNRSTTNPTLTKFGIDIEKESNKTIENLFVSTQNKCNGFYPTSFEESLILANPNNNLIHKALNNTHPRMYITWKASILDKSHSIQNYLSKSKGVFATSLLFELINNKQKDNELVLPKYINDGLEFINNKLNANGDDDNEQQSS